MGSRDESELCPLVEVICDQGYICSIVQFHSEIFRLGHTCQPFGLPLEPNMLVGCIGGCSKSVVCQFFSLLFVGFIFWQCCCEW